MFAKKQCACEGRHAPRGYRTQSWSRSTQSGRGGACNGARGWFHTPNSGVQSLPVKAERPALVSVVGMNVASERGGCTRSSRSSHRPWRRLFVVAGPRTRNRCDVVGYVSSESQRVRLSDSVWTDENASSNFAIKRTAYRGNGSVATAGEKDGRCGSGHKGGVFCLWAARGRSGHTTALRGAINHFGGNHPHSAHAGLGVRGEGKHLTAGSA